MKTKRGFTLVELSVAIVFISVLLLTIAMVTMSMTKSYHKGITMKSINTIGLDLIDEFSTAVSDSPVFDAESLCKSLGDTITDKPVADCLADDAQKFIHQQYNDDINLTKNGVDYGLVNRPVAGVFCTGKYSYVWNTGYIVSQDENNHTMSSGFYHGGSAIGDHFRLRKYSDPGREFCRNNFKNSLDDNNKYSDPTNDLNTIVEAKLASGELVHKPLSSELINTSDIAIYSLTINAPTVNENSGRSLYTGSFVLGSITGDIDLNTNPITGEEGEYSSCKLESASKFDVEYCATNKFNFAVRAMGGNSGS